MLKQWKYSDPRAAVMSWDINESINDIKVSPTENWIAVATNTRVILIDLNAQNQNEIILGESENVATDENENVLFKFKTSNITWDPKSMFLFAGCDNGNIKVLFIDRSSQDGQE